MRNTGMNPELFWEAVDVFREVTPIVTFHQLRYWISEDPEYWWTPYHFYAGMAIRNLFRNRVCLDEDLPTGNWDDYYIEVVEAAVADYFRA